MHSWFAVLQLEIVASTTFTSWRPCLDLMQLAAADTTRTTLYRGREVVTPRVSSLWLGVAAGYPCTVSLDGEKRPLIFKRLSWPSRLALRMAVALSVRARSLTMAFLPSATTIKSTYHSSPVGSVWPGAINTSTPASLRSATSSKQCGSSSTSLSQFR